MKHLSLKSRFIIIIVLLIFCSAGTNLLCLERLNYQNKANSEISEIWFPAVSKISDISINMMGYLNLEYLLLGAKTEEQKSKILHQMDERAADMSVYWRQVRPLLNERQNSSLDQFLKNWDLYTAESEKYKEALKKEGAVLAKKTLDESNTIFDEASEI